MARSIHRIGRSKSVGMELTNLEHQHRVEEARRTLGQLQPTQIVQGELPTAPSQQIIQQVVYLAAPQPRSIPVRESNALPIILNILLMPGTGQLVQGRIGTGLAFIFFWILSIILILAFVGVFLAPIVFLLALVDVCQHRRRLTYR